MRLLLRTGVCTGALLVAATLGACSSSKTGNAASSAIGSSASSSSGSSSAPSTATSSGAAAPASSGRSTQAVSPLVASLLTPAEIAPDFRSQPTSGTSGPLPCTPKAPPLEKQVPSSDRAKALYVSKSGKLALQENVLAYDAPSTASKAVAVARTGLACKNGLSGTARMQIAGPSDVRKLVSTHVDAALAWTVQTTKFTGSIIVVRAGAKLMTLQFAKTLGASSASVNTKRLFETAVAKVVNGH